MRRSHLISSLIASIVLTCSFLCFATNVKAQSVPVATTEELYTAVNDPANEGATIVLAPGIYMLSVNNPSNVPRPNKGRLDLRLNMSLVGIEGDRNAVIIDAMNLPASSFTGTPGPNAAVRLGRGTNSLQWLTVGNAVNAQANIDSGLQMPGTALITIAHCESSGSNRGMNI